MSAQGNALGNLFLCLTSPNPERCPGLTYGWPVGPERKRNCTQTLRAGPHPISATYTHTADDSITTVIHRAILNRRLVPMVKMMVS